MNRCFLRANCVWHCITQILSLIQLLFYGSLCFSSLIKCPFILQWLEADNIDHMSRLFCWHARSILPLGWCLQVVFFNCLQVQKSLSFEYLKSDVLSARSPSLTASPLFSLHCRSNHADPRRMGWVLVLCLGYTWSIAWVRSPASDLAISFTGNNSVMSSINWMGDLSSIQRRPYSVWCDHVYFVYCSHTKYLVL